MDVQVLDGSNNTNLCIYLVVGNEDIEKVWKYIDSLMKWKFDYKSG